VGVGSPERDRFHFVEIDAEWGHQRFICLAPKGAACRMLPVCQFAGGRCADHEGEHAEDCTESDTFADFGECIIEPWITNGEECGRGEVRIPVTTEWDGDWWLWRPAADHTARIVAALDAERDRQTADLHPAGAEYGRVRAMFARVVAVVEGVDPC
jgi:hypothetical protein